MAASFQKHSLRCRNQQGYNCPFLGSLPRPPPVKEPSGIFKVLSSLSRVCWLAAPAGQDTLVTVTAGDPPPEAGPPPHGPQETLRGAGGRHCEAQADATPGARGLPSPKCPRHSWPCHTGSTWSTAGGQWLSPRPEVPPIASSLCGPGEERVGGGGGFSGAPTNIPCLFRGKRTPLTPKLGAEPEAPKEHPPVAQVWGHSGPPLPGPAPRGTAPGAFAHSRSRVWK